MPVFRAPAHRYGFISQARVLVDLDRCIKAIQVAVKNDVPGHSISPCLPFLYGGRIGKQDCITQIMGLQTRRREQMCRYLEILHAIYRAGHLERQVKYNLDMILGIYIP